MSQTPAQRISFAAHALLAHANPLAKQQLQHLAQLLAAKLPQNEGAMPTALEIGCGPGAFAQMLAQQCAVDLHAIDIHPGFLARAQEAASESQLQGKLRFSALDAAELGSAPHPAHYDALICIGSSQAFGNPQQALARCASLLRPGGHLLFADLTWQSAPAAEFLDFLGTSADYYWLESEEQAVFAKLGLHCEEVLRASKAAWQSYESAVLQGRLAYANSLSSEEAAMVRQRAQAWAAAYEQYGKQYLGFSAYLLSVPTQGAA